MDASVLWPLGVYAGLVLGLVGFMLIVSHFLGERHAERATHENYESGIAPTGSARIRFSAHYYLVAMFFVIFDLETVFLLTWALAVRELGWGAYIQVLVFIAVLGLGLAYVWRLGALDWGPARGRTVRGGKG